MSDEQQFIWISRWDGRDGFQHYKPERDRPPAWIKQYTKQLYDARYLRLSDRQRALLVDLRCIFAVTMMRLPYDQQAISLHRHVRTYRSDLEALNRAGFIELISITDLESNLERVYSPPARARRGLEVEEEPPTPADAGVRTFSRGKTRARPAAPQAENGDRRLERALAFTRNAGGLYERLDFEEEIAKYGLDLEESQVVYTLWDEIRANGSEPEPEGELPWEGDEPPVVED